MFNLLLACRLLLYYCLPSYLKALSVYTMRLSILITALCASASATQAHSHSDYPSEIQVSIQSIGTSISTPDSLARIQYNPATLEAEIISYDAPGLPPTAGLARVGIYDTKAKAWTSSTSATSVENFSKGYAPIITLSLDATGKVLGVSCRSDRIDAGQTRDFGPKVIIKEAASGKGPELNRPIVLSREGKVEVEVPEKTFLQK
jgi:hypothetical protein